VIGSLVARCIADGKTFADLSDEEWAEIHPVFAETKPPIDAWSSVSGRDSSGGTSPAQVERTRAIQREALERDRAWADDQLAREDGLFTRS
jgi:argininosuccinate lyase